MPLRYALQPSIPHLTRSALHRCLQRHGISRLPDIEGDKPKRQRFKRYPIGFFHIDIAEVQTAEGKLYLFVGIDRTSKFAVTQLVDEHRFTKPNHPRTNGQVERMNRTIKEATVKRFHYENHDQLRTHLADFRAAYNFARRLKTLSGLTPYEYIAKIWTAEPDRFIVNPIHQMPGLNTEPNRSHPVLLARMGLRTPKTISVLVRWDANLKITCAVCGHSGVYDPKQVAAYFHSSGWNTAWEVAHLRFRCEGKFGKGCGAKAAQLSMEPKPLPYKVPQPEPLDRDLKAEIARRR